MSPAALSEVRKTPLLAPYLRPALYVSELKSRTKAASIEELVAVLAADKLTRHPEGVLEAVSRREDLGSTGLGKGIALPHARSTLVTQRAVVVARSAKGIDFDAMDGQPAHLFFLVVAPPLERDPVYLKLMAEIVRAVRLAKTRQRLLDAPDFKAVRRILIGAIDE
ncbi:MAG TPA: PTS sugar transporter subunit IIA [Acidobacteriota bacterium]|nr:PTS sugar transporter subunit IIA [Acidobacteriota bacterium]